MPFWHVSMVAIFKLSSIASWSLHLEVMAPIDLPQFLAEVGLDAFSDKFTVDVPALIEMDNDDLLDVAVELQMSSDHRKTFLQLMERLRRQYGSMSFKHFKELMEEHELSIYLDKIEIDTEKLLIMDEEELKDVATDAGMKKDNRQKFLKLISVLHERLSQEECLQHLRKLMTENGLSEFAELIQVDVEKLLTMDDDELRDQAVDLGMSKDSRKKFLQVIGMMRDRSSDSSTDFEVVVADPSQELLDFLGKKDLEKYAVNMFNHRNEDYGQVQMLMEMEAADLMVVAVDCGFAEEDRKKLRELVMEEHNRILAEPSIGGRLFDALQNVRVEKMHGVLCAYCPFKQIACEDYLYAFPPDIEPKEHPCVLRVMEAQIPKTYVDQDIAKELVVLVVGQTGAGKSTQIDGMLNYLLGIKWEEGIRFKVVDELQTATKESLQAGGATSQTDAVTAYKIPAVKGGPVQSNVTIVDTPGFGDTRGLHFDYKLVDQMKKFFNGMSDQVNLLTGVCFVVPASEARLTGAQQYVWNAILGLFGKDITENMLLCFTFADGKKPPALEAVRACDIPMRAFFKFNNSALFEDPSGPASDALSKMFWEMGQRNMAEFFDSLVLLNPKSLQLSKQVMEEREQLEVSLENLGPQVKLILGYASSFQEQADQFALFDDTLEGAKDFKIKVQVPKFRKIPTTSNTTTCIECDRTCHKDCAYSNDGDKARCCAMNLEGFCRECPKKCHWSKHQNVPYILEWYMEVQEKTLADLKAKYDEANKGKLDKEKIMKGLLADMQKSHQVVAALLMRMKKCRERLNEIAMRPHTMPATEYVQQLIENEKNNQQKGWQNRVAALQKLKRDSSLLKDAEDPRFSENMYSQWSHDKKVQRAAQSLKKKETNAGGWSWWPVRW